MAPFFQPFKGNVWGDHIQKEHFFVSGRQKGSRAAFREVFGFDALVVGQVLTTT